MTKNGMGISYETLLKLLEDFKESDMKDDELKERLKEVDIVALWYAFYFTDLDCEYYKREYNKTRNQRFTN